MGHRWTMDYSLDWMNLYSQNNQWIYNHYTSAHEYTGQHTATLDLDVPTFI